MIFEIGNTSIYRTTIEAATGEELDLEVAFEFQPYEPPTWNYPGCDASVGIYEANILYPDGSQAEVCLIDEILFKEEIMEALDREVTTR